MKKLNEQTKTVISTILVLIFMGTCFCTYKYFQVSSKYFQVSREYGIQQKIVAQLKTDLSKVQTKEEFVRVYNYYFAKDKK